MSDDEGTQEHLPKTFEINDDTDTFQLDGNDFVPFAGEIHYFRVPRENWSNRLQKLKQANLNCVTTAVNWSLHEKFPGLYDFDKQLDVAEFIRLAEKHELYVILKMGPQVDADCEFGGLPYWLLGVNPKMKCRTQDESFTHFYGRWLKYLYGQVQPFLVGNGGPIIMIQIEDAYGCFPVHDRNYLFWLRDVNRCHVGKKALLFTSDFPSKHDLERGRIHGVFSTVKFGATNESALLNFEQLKIIQPKGPLFNSQFNVGLTTYWEDHGINLLNTEIFQDNLTELISNGIGFNLRMFHGGTNFGLTSGSKSRNKNCCTSYDFDAPLTEAGDLTEKYSSIKKLLRVIQEEDESKKSEESKSVDELILTEKGNYGAVELNYAASILQLNGSSCCKSMKSLFPKSFEEMGVKEGFVAYTTVIQCDTAKGDTLKGIVRDMAYVVADFKQKIGIMEDDNLEIPFPLTKGTQLTFLVQSYGRRTFCPGKDVSKGLFRMYIGNTYLDNWTITVYQMSNPYSIKKLFNTLHGMKNNADETSTLYPAFYVGTFILPDVNPGEEWYNERADGPYKGTVSDSGSNKESGGSGSTAKEFKRSTATLASEAPSEGVKVRDTFLQLTGWMSGVVYMNSICLGRYYNKGPQRTLFVPGSFLRAHPKKNNLAVLELEAVSEKLEVEFVPGPIWIEKEQPSSSVNANRESEKVSSENTDPSKKN